jgi:putative sporulation protein YtaF
VGWTAAVLIGLVSNFDNLGAGLALGVRGSKIDAVTNLIIAGLTMVATGAAMTCGHALSKLLPSAVTGWLGPLIIIAIGIGTTCTSLETSLPGRSVFVRWAARRSPRQIDEVISRREAMVLGAALALNNLATGIGAGVSGVPALATTVSAGLISLACVGGASHLGRLSGRSLLGRHAPLVAGTILLAVGAAMLPGLAPVG